MPPRLHTPALLFDRCAVTVVSLHVTFFPEHSHYLENTCFVTLPLVVGGGSYSARFPCHYLPIPYRCATRVPDLPTGSLPLPACLRFPTPVPHLQETFHAFGVHWIPEFHYRFCLRSFGGPTCPPPRPPATIPTTVPTYDSVICLGFPPHLPHCATTFRNIPLPVLLGLGARF